MTALALPFDDALLSDPALGHALGREHARLGLTPTAALLGADNPLGRGFRQARGLGPLRPQRPADACDRHGLALRVEAWLHGRDVDPLGLPRAALAPLLGGRCPVTRRDLRGLGPQDAPLVGLREDAWLAPGHLLQLDRGAAQALHGRSLHALDQAATQQAAAQAQGQALPGLDAAALGRLADLRSFVTRLPHAQALRPMRVLPPARLWLLNPAQGLQAWLMRNALQAGAARRLQALASALPTGAARSGLHRLGLHLTARLMAGGHGPEASAARQALEDQAEDPGLLGLWRDWAGACGESGCRALLAQALRLDGPARWRGQDEVDTAWGLALPEAGPPWGRSRGIPAPADPDLPRAPRPAGLRAGGRRRLAVLPARSQAEGRG